MDGTPFEFAGIRIPTDAPLFIAILVPHVLAALVCVVSGLVAMLSRKGRGRHTGAGAVYYAGLAVVFLTACGLAALRWKEAAYLFYLGSLAFALATFGRSALRRGWKGGVRPHILGMGSSYVVMLIAFYMDNGPNLPLWRDLPPAAYWLIPLSVGVPFILYALVRHPLAIRGTGSAKK